MTTTTTLLVCVLLGQAEGGTRFQNAIPVPQASVAQPALAQSSARRDADSQTVMPSSRFGTPTAAAAEVAPASSLGQQPLTPPASVQASDLSLASENRAVISSTPALVAPSVVQPTLNAAAQANVVAPRINVQPQTSIQPVQKARTAANLLVEQAFPSPEDAADNTTRLALRDVIAASPDPARRAAAIQTYWEASTLLADWQFAAEEFELMGQIPAPRDAAEQAVLRASQAAAKARLIEARMAANSAQFAMADIVPTVDRTAAAPPLPIDAPFAGVYNTHFETLFSARVAPAGLRRIHETLPMRKDLVDARAEAVFASADAVQQQIEAHRAGRVSLAQLLHEFELLRSRRGKFLGALRDYNLDIAQYAMGTSRPNDPVDKLVGMMIDSPMGTSARGSSNVAISNGASASGNTVIVVPAGATAPAFGAPRAVIQSGATISAPAAARVSAPRVATNPSRFNAQVTSEATALPQPPANSSMGSFRDVTGETQPQVMQPTSRFGTPSGSAQFGAGAQLESQPIGAQIGGAASGEASATAPALPALPPAAP